MGPQTFLLAAIVESAGSLVLFLFVAAAVGGVAAMGWERSRARATQASRQAEADRLLSDAKRKSEELLKAADVDVQKKHLEVKERFERETAETRDEIKASERRIAKREDVLDKKLDVLSTKERKIESSEQSVAAREKAVAEKTDQVEQLYADQRAELLRVSQLTRDDAKALCLKRIEQEVEHEAGQMVEKILTTAKENAREKARNITIEAIQRYAAEHTCETVIATVDVPADEMKGRIIGREGRNIRAFEKTTGVTLIVDDTPGIVQISCFDPVRKEIARRSLDKLVRDGRIHPTRIEEVVAESEKEIEEQISEFGRQAALEAKVNGVHKKALDLMGRLQFRTSYGQNVLRHSVEVAYLCQIIADELGMSSDFCEIIEIAAPMHDIGKIGIPDKILLKPGPLNADEMDIMKTHTSIGHEILKDSPSPYLKMGAIIALNHHERFNGEGYPTGLHGEDIPMEARIVTTADIFDALTSTRPYKQSWTVEATLEEISRQKTRQLDPNCVDALFNTLDEIIACQEHAVEMANTKNS
ncbi:MAG: DUF3552 domain-containing protein [Planctomycetes bacterium]|nr:DUF3552 domain-containing protein [Planctomycetota bacterium]